MTDSAADVPGKYDLWLNGHGYILDRTIDPSSLRVFSAAEHQYTPTFLARSNVTGSYGDNQQDFWMVLGQNDWSGGEQQKYIRVNDAESRRRYWRGSAVDVSVEGQASLAQGTVSYGLSGSVAASCEWRGLVAYVVGTHLYTINHGDASATDIGAITSTLSGLTQYGLCSDDVGAYIAYPSGGTNGCIRKWDGASTFTNFAASLGVSSTEIVNNTLFGAGHTSGGAPKLYSFDTAGTPTLLYTWQGADGTAGTQTITRLRRFAGSLLILMSQHTPGLLWEYTSDAPTVLAELPPSFYATEVVSSQGIIFIGGSYYKRDTSGSNFFQRPAIFYYVDGSLNLLWRADSFTAASYAIGSTIPAANPVPFQNGILFWDSIRSQLTYYDIESGGINGISAASSAVGLGTSASAFIWLNGPDSSHAAQFPDPNNNASTGYVRTSMFDADSSLTKYWKSVKVDADLPTGSSVDIAYRLNDLDGSYSSVQSSAASGTEYAIGQSGRSISIQVTLNNGSGGTPVLKRIYVRGMPLLDTFRRESYVIDCTGRIDQGMLDNPVRFRDGTSSTLTGLQNATNLRTAATATSPFSVTDEFGTYTGLIEPDSFRLEYLSPGEYRAFFTVRET